MSKKIIIWGAIISAFGLLAFVVFVIFSVLTGGAFRTAANISGYIGLFSFPASVLIWLIRKTLR